MTRRRSQSNLPAYGGMSAFAGDIHNHCAISYGHGSIEDAYANARMQLDFASVTGHASWHDMPEEPAHVADYHRKGFARLEEQWEHVQDVTDGAHVDGEFVSFLSFEWHSMTYGDHCVYYRGGRGPLAPARAKSLEELRGELRAVQAAGLPAMVLPHHIGYLAGRRGVNWDTYSAELSPVAEMISMHGSGEQDDSPRPYLHTMGPRDAGSTAIAGLGRGHRFGFIGSTDHHSAHPGSHGHGLAMVWAPELTRDSLWEAIQARRTYAITGDRIMLATSVDGAPMGSEITGVGPREIAVQVHGGAALETVQVLRNGEVIAENRPGPTSLSHTFDGILSIAFGWGEVGAFVDWDVEVSLSGGEIHAVEPRLRGYDTLADQAGETDRYAFSSWQQTSRSSATLRTRTYGNPTVSTDATQQLALHVEADPNAVLTVTANGRTLQRTVAELLTGPAVSYIGGFLSGAFVMHRAVPYEAASLTWELADAGSGDQTDIYYVRVRQVNDQHAWSSPTWVTNSRT
ncbi:DUF3604 domain-containing protein [Ruania rhizosphaerae]|uniref:DUF3604 domain-containing protein n=1 Tax=Ruania rhizosphaerae TaxID=1840413 RepID=UPI00135A2D9F|nr:DUF3604 domain-containing protein [Ruania rhizosphaerae]